MPITSRVFRRRVRGKLQKRYTIRIRFPDGTVRDRVGFTDKAATQQRAAILVREIERHEVGLHDQYADARRTPLAAHVDAFLVAMQNGSLSRRRRGRVSDDWVSRSRKRLVAMLEHLKATRLEHLVLSEAEEMLHERVSTDWSTKTRDHHASLLRQFGRWLVDDGRWSANPYERLRPISDQSTVTFRRWALTVPQLAALVEAAEVRGVQEYARVNPTASTGYLDKIRFQGRARAMVFKVAAYTGLRRAEVLRIKWSEFVSGPEPAVMVWAESAKNRKNVRLELPAWLGDELAAFRVECSKHQGRPVAEHDQVFAGVSYRHITERLKEDAVFAKVGTWDATKSRVLSADGRVIDFHALRGTCATMLDDAGIGPKAMQEHMRHSDLRLTMDAYVQARRAMMRASVEKLVPPYVPPLARPVIAEADASCHIDDNERRSGT